MHVRTLAARRETTGESLAAAISFVSGAVAA